jgi:hypothetical protein
MMDPNDDMIQSKIFLDPFLGRLLEEKIFLHFKFFYTVQKICSNVLLEMLI